MPWHNYALYIEFGAIKRRLELDENPWALFKTLRWKGSDPVFMLRKVSNAMDFGEEPTEG